jgi:hypothetical protein
MNLFFAFKANIPHERTWVVKLAICCILLGVFLCRNVLGNVVQSLSAKAIAFCSRLVLEAASAFISCEGDVCVFKEKQVVSCKTAGLLLLCFFMFIGGHLPFVQIAAWVLMIQKDLKHCSLRDAVREAFEVGDHCHLCSFVQQSCLKAGSSFSEKTEPTPLFDVLFFLQFFSQWQDVLWRNYVPASPFPNSIEKSPPIPPPKISA